MITTIVFDFYGVFQPDPYVQWLTQNGLQRSDIFDKLAQQLDHGEIDRPLFLQRLSEVLGRTVTYEEIYGSSPSLLSHDVVEIASKLKKSYRIALLSNASHHLRTRLINEGIIELFDLIVISSEVGVAKPNPEVYLMLLHQLNELPENCLYIDDNPAFVEAGERLAIKSIRFTTPENLRDSLAQLHML